MANPIKWIFNQATRIYRRLVDGKVDRQVRTTDTHADRFLVQSSIGDLDRLVGALQEGQPLDRWVLDFRQSLKETYISEYLVARGGRDAMTQSDWGQLGAMLKQQYRYLDGFANDIASGNLSTDGRLQIKRVRARAQMYFNGSSQAYERGKSNSLGMPRFPAYPGDGSTQCLTNCGCHWDVTETEEAWLCVWTLGPHEHCPDCVRRAGEWNPYRIPKR